MERRPIKTIRNQVYQILKDDICEGRFAPGQWLQENELAERLCVSRSPIREALAGGGDPQQGCVCKRVYRAGH